MKPVIIIAIAFVLLIPIPVFAQVVDFNIDQEVYYQFQMITMSGVVNVDPDMPEIFVEIFSPEKKLVGFTKLINPDGTFGLQFQANPDVYTIDGEYTYKVTYENSVEKIIHYQKFRDIAPFVDQTKNPCSYVDRYNNESSYEEWFRENYPEYISIYEAVGIQDNQKLCDTLGMSEAEIQAREEIPILCANIKELKVAPEYQGDIGLNDPVYMEAVRDAQYQYSQQMQKCYREYQLQIDQRVVELQEPKILCGDGTMENNGQCILDPNYVPLETKEAMYDELIIKLCNVYDGELENLKKYGYSESSNVYVDLSTEEIIEEIEYLKKEVGCKKKTVSSLGGGCLIATATYGSELAPQVQQLRELRDNSLLNTESGSTFMESFNDFYYSFSPIIADYERENLVFKEMVKIVITPMITSLSILNYVDMDSEVEVLGYGISLIILNVGMYFGIPAIVIMRIRK